jgi:C-terminal processing protease CtpA/Prc
VTVAFEIEDGNGNLQELSLTKEWVAIQTVPVSTIHEVEGRPVGYLLFATFVETSIPALDQAFAEFQAAGVREVVVDLRYNGGGLIGVARHFMHLLVGAVADGEVAYRVRYNDHYAKENEERELGVLDRTLPHVDHVVFITTGSSLSASELLINSVSAHVPVSIIGGTTGGKPVGSHHFDFCDQIAVPVTFRLLNADDFGDYFDGLPATCAAPDDLTHALGDAREASLAAALHRLATGQCLPPPEGEGASAPEPRGLRTPPAVERAHDPWPELGGLR